MIQILIVDDEKPICDLIQMSLTRAGYHCMCVYDGLAAADILERNVFDLILLDVMLPNADGFELMEYIRPLGIPVIFLTSLDSSTDRVVGLELGADDYVVKPFDPRELLARIRTVLRRASDKGQAAAQSDIRRFAGWTLNVRSRELSQGDERIALSDAMYRLLLVFLDEPFAVLSREYLLRQTQGRDADVFDRSVDIQVSRLRGVLKDTGTSKIIKTVRGGGYMLSVDVEHDA